MKRTAIIILIIICVNTIFGQFGTYSNHPPGIFNEISKTRKNAPYIDSLERKQGHWMIKKYYNCEDSLTIDSVIVAEGNYLNGEKTGLWAYYSVSGFFPCYEGEKHVVKEIYRTEEFTNDSIYVNSPYNYSIVFNRDTSYLKATMYFNHPRICAECIKKKDDKQIICNLFGEKNNEFIRQTFTFESNNEVFEFIESGCMVLY